MLGVTVILSEGIAEVEESHIKPSNVIVRSFDYALRASLRMTDTTRVTNNLRSSVYSTSSAFRSG